MSSSGFGARSLPSQMWRAASAAPSAPPASPAAGWTHTWSKIPAARMRSFATQLSATPPAMTRVCIPVIFCAVRASRTMASSVTSWIASARSIYACVKGVSGARGGMPKSAVHFAAFTVRNVVAKVKYSIASISDPSSLSEMRCSRIMRLYASTSRLPARP